MNDPIIDLQCDDYFMGEALRQVLASEGHPNYAGNVVKQPFINDEDRAAIQRGIDRSAEISRRMASGEIRIPRGVYRFKTHEEADEWLERKIEGENKNG